MQLICQNWRVVVSAGTIFLIQIFENIPKMSRKHTQILACDAREMVPARVAHVLYLNKNGDITIPKRLRYSGVSRHIDSLQVDYLHDERDLVTFRSTSEPWVRSLHAWRFFQITVDPELLNPHNYWRVEKTLRNIRRHTTITAHEIVANDTHVEDLLYRNVINEQVYNF